MSMLDTFFFVKFYLLWEGEFAVTVRVEEIDQALALNKAGAEVVVVL